MPEPETIGFSYKEVAEALLKKYGIHEGIWGIYLKFGIGGANVGDNEIDIKPAAIIPVLQIGLQKMEKETSIAVDAAKVNPKPAAHSKVSSKRSRH